MQKFGMLYLNGGVWKGKRLISQNWVNESTTGKKRSDYGYLWWKFRYGKPIDNFSAWGAFGQYISVFPGRNLVVTMTSVIEDGTFYTVYLKLMKDFILKAVDSAPSPKALPNLKKEMAKLHQWPVRYLKSEKRMHPESFSLLQEDALRICSSPNLSQRNTLIALAKKVKRTHAPNSCESLYQKLIALTQLDLSETQLTDVSSLKGLTNLTHLNLKQNMISDVSALRGLNNLTVLELGSNQLTDVNDLKGLTRLTKLWLYSNQLTDVSALKGLSNLTLLALQSNQLTEVNSLRGLTKLTVLELGSNQLTDVSVLKGLTMLTKLWLYSNQLKNCSPRNLDELKSGKNCN